MQKEKDYIFEEENLSQLKKKPAQVATGRGTIACKKERGEKRDASKICNCPFTPRAF